jgi:serine/threonine-protein kinase HipA
MAERHIQVYVQIGDEDVLSGRLWSHRGRGTESMTFAYDETYLARGSSYAVDPSQLDLYAGQQQTPQGRAIFGAFSDAAPDTWGRRVIDRRETKEAKAESRTRRSFGEIDYLLGVRDDLRQGALRFHDPETRTFLASDRTGVPVLTSLGELLTAAERMERGQETREDLRLLTGGGSSLGGARPKAHVFGEHGKLAIAKFPSPRDDDLDVMRWEFVALRLARDAGIDVPDGGLHQINGKWVLVIDRFDRVDETRIGYVSALTMLGLQDGDRASYLDIADVITTHSPRATEDLGELWRRVAFSVLISNYDDHLRNHGFLRTSSAGWSLSPAFDLNPDPSGKRELHTAIDLDDYAASIDLLLSVSDFFRVDRKHALEILAEVSRATARWREVAGEVGLEQEIERMEPAFEHEASADARAVVES